MILFLSQYINWIILAVAVITAGVALYLYFRVRELPRSLGEMIAETAKQWGLGEYAAFEKDPRRLLEAMRKKLETADTNLKSEIRGFLTGGDQRPELRVNSVVMAKNIGRILTEIFPLLGILGTVCALSVSVGYTESVDATASVLPRVMALFGVAVDSTIYGLICAVICMLVFGYLDTRLEETLASAKQYREVMDRAFSLTAAGD
ncbi:MAG: MotA/TolQ/ExbB proton channel family protein [Candidatus Brocadiia bacterium]